MAQLVRAFGSHPKGHRFKSCWAHFSIPQTPRPFQFLAEALRTLAGTAIARFAERLRGASRRGFPANVREQ